jgi:hypothetical protein
MIDLDTIGYFLFMEQQEQNQKEQFSNFGYRDTFTSDLRSAEAIPLASTKREGEE